MKTDVLHEVGKQLMQCAEDLHAQEQGNKHAAMFSFASGIISGIAVRIEKLETELTERRRELEMYRRQWMEAHTELSNAQALIGLRNVRIVELELRVVELERQIYGSK